MTNLKEKIKHQLIADEGLITNIYKDSLGLKTAGIGHLLTIKDPEYNLPVKTPVSMRRVEEWFEIDIENAYITCCKIFVNFDLFVEELQLILLNMAFNLGFKRFKGFKKFIKNVEAGDFVKAAAEMQNSLWYTQVGNRSKRLQARMLKI